MASAPRPWTVLPHDPIVALGANLRVVSGRLPRGSINRRMAVARLGDGRLVFYNGVPLEPAAMASLEAWGTPAFLLVPNGLHRLDIHAWKQRYPAMKLLTPAAVRAKVEAVAHVDDTFDLFPADPNVKLIPFRGSRIGEAFLQVTSPEGVAIVVGGDTIMNIPHRGGLDGLVIRLIGSSGGPRVTPLAKMLTVGDKAALRAHLEELAATAKLRWLVPSHGDVVEGDAAGALKAAAARL